MTHGSSARLLGMQPLVERCHILGLLFVIVLLVGACSDSTSNEPVALPALPIEVPRFVAASGSLGELTGTTFVGSVLPAELGGDVTDRLGGAVMLNPESGDAQVLTAMHWFVEGERANITLSELAESELSGVPTWNVVSAWTLELGPDMVVTVGTNVCMAPIHTYDWKNGEFIAVTNREQNMALGAWAVTVNGPTPYADLDTLVCERFVP